MALPRPPWWQGGTVATAVCRDCGACVEACPEGIVTTGSDGTPLVDFRRGGCTLCGDCRTACPSDVLADRGAPAFAHRAAIGAACMALQGVVCRLCEEACAPRAIRFTLLTGGRALAQVAETRCNGCGACVGVCPSQAIDLAPPAPMKASA